MMSFVDALTALKKARPVLKTVRVVVRAGWVQQTHALMDHLDACYAARTVEAFADARGFERWMESMWEMCREGFDERVAWDIGPL